MHQGKKKAVSTNYDYFHFNIGFLIEILSESFKKNKKKFMNKIEDLIQILELEQIEENIYKGESHKTPWKRVYGGQVLAQSLTAAYRTVPSDRYVHSMHGYFILAGDIERPIVYNIERTRDGGSFTTRRVTAIQHGQAIFVAAFSFQLQQDGLDHQITIPNVPSPDMLVSDEKLIEKYKNLLPDAYLRIHENRPIEFRPVEKISPLEPKKRSPFRHVWFKAKGQLPDDKRLHQQVLAYASDYNLLTTAIFPHLDKQGIHESFLASLDHAMWFHRDFRADEWLLYALDSPSASNARGFTRGNIFNEAGTLVASVVQEGLIRKKK
ncbi:MAG: acyl-CoA thioesterase II [Saprospiraceae bacterium]